MPKQAKKSDFSLLFYTVNEQNTESLSSVLPGILARGTQNGSSSALPNSYCTTAANRASTAGHGFRIYLYPVYKMNSIIHIPQTGPLKGVVVHSIWQAEGEPSFQARTYHSQRNC